MLISNKTAKSTDIRPKKVKKEIDSCDLTSGHNTQDSSDDDDINNNEWLKTINDLYTPVKNQSEKGKICYVRKINDEDEEERLSTQ